MLTQKIAKLDTILIVIQKWKPWNSDKIAQLKFDKMVKFLHGKS